MVVQLLAALVLVSAGTITRADVLTVGDTSFGLSWVTAAPEATAVVYGRAPGRLDERAESAEAPTRFHYLSVTGLEPGVTYYCRIAGAGEQHPAPPRPPFKVTTLVPPPGRLLFSFAVLSDVHVGEDIAGLMVPPLPFLPALTNGFTWRNPVDNYWDFSLRAAVRQINASGADFTVVNGDVTAWYQEAEFKTAKDRLAKLTHPFYMVRGNHDRVGERPQDFFKSVFGLDSTWYSVDHDGFHFVILDDNRLDNGFNGFPEEEFAWLSADLSSHREMPTFIFSHRPLGARAVDVVPSIRMRLHKIFGSNPQIVGVFNAHSHAATIVTVPATGNVPYITVNATKEYPLGYAMVRVYEGGYIFTFTPTDCPDCREWRDLTRGEYFGQAPRKLLKKITDRAMVYTFKARTPG
jgi:3',5'-cyclic-AMP phosphodiesterase